jgi:hypothetical protein
MEAQPNSKPLLDVSPRVFRAGSEVAVTIRASFPGGTIPGAQYRVLLVPADGVAGSLLRPEPRDLGRPGRAGTLSTRCAFPTEQEYFFRLEDLSGAKPVVAAEARAYAVRGDLFARSPWKGDLHMHSRRSDGLDDPAEVAAACRRIGLDFMALTDHHRREPSLEAIRAFESCPMDLVMLPGEEVHPPGCPVHIVNAGGTLSVNAAFEGERYASEVAALAADLEAAFPGSPEADRLQYAAASWCFREVRACGGLGIFCHPSWISRSRYDVPAALTDAIFDRQPYDALELIGGYHVHEAESNSLQVARWAEERARGKRIPVVGVSDAHGCNNGKLFGWYYTVAFAPTPAWEDVRPAICAERSVAVEARPGEVPRVFGPYRLVTYAHFLLREVFPRHDELCAREGELMLAWARGDRSVAGELEGLRGRVRALYRELWAPA